MTTPAPQPTSQPELPPTVPITGGPMRWLAAFGSAMIEHPDGETRPHTIIRLRLDDDKGVHYYTFTAEDFSRFADWCHEQAVAGRTGITPVQQIPPGLVIPGNGQP